MKIQINSTLLRDGLNKILSVVDKKNSRPILTNCLVRAFDGYIELISTDLEVSAKVLIKAEVDNVGEFCINTKNIFDIVRELPDEIILLDIDNEQNLLKLSCGNIKFSLLITNTEDYPKLNFNAPTKNQFSISSENISKIISKTIHSISTDETRINLNGIYVQKIGEKLRSVAIDGHRLALLDIENFNFENDLLTDGLIIPKKGILELKRIAETYPEIELNFSVDESFMYISANEQYFLNIRLIAREYPKYQTVIPSKTSFSITMEKNILVDAIKRVKLLANEKTNGIKINFISNQLVVSASHNALGHGEEKIPVEYTGKEMEIGFNAKYILDTMSVIDANDITFDFNNELSPVIVRSDEDNAFLGIVMPLKI